MNKFRSTIRNSVFCPTIAPILQKTSAFLQLLLCFTLLYAAGHAWAQSASPTFPNPGKASMSRDNQQALGMEAAAQVYQKMPVLSGSSPNQGLVQF